MSSRVRVSNGVIVDTETGVVVDESPLSLTPEWRIYDEDDVARARTGAPLTPRVHDYGLTTDIGASYRDLEAQRLRRLHSIIRARSGGQLTSALELLNRYCRMLGLDARVCDEAATAARHIVSQGLAGISLRIGVAAAIIYAAMRNGIPLTTVMYGLGLSRGEYTRIMRLISTRLGGAARDVSHSVVRYISHIVNSLGLPEEVAVLATRIYVNVRARLQGTTPRGIAATTVYIAAKVLGHDVPQKTVAQAVGMTEAAVRMALKRAGIVVKYVLGCIGVEVEWRQGRDNYGLRTPQLICSLYGVECGKTSPRNIVVKDNMIHVTINCSKHGGGGS